jgi:hypothetical protein
MREYSGIIKEMQDHNFLPAEKLTHVKVNTKTHTHIH